jgi:tRNA threonylcarbamoyladenosine biosynthesis protein TsaB
MNSGLTLAVDGSTYAGSVALIRNHEVIAERQLERISKPGREGRAEQFMPMVADCLRDGQVRACDLARIVCGEGPGSFTSLRVAASIAKGIAVGAGIPLYAVSSLLLIVAAASRADGTWLSALPAMRGEVFIAPFEIAGGVVRAVESPRIVSQSALEDEVVRYGAKLAGPARDEDEMPHARGVARVLDPVIASGPVSLDSWEPMYGRLAEAQVKWEAAHGRPLSAAG